MMKFFLVIIIGMVLEKFYLPFNTSYFPIKKKSFLFENNENIFFVIFESGKLISFSKMILKKISYFSKIITQIWSMNLSTMREMNIQEYWT